jgi:hypothetical protein
VALLRVLAIALVIYFVTRWLRRALVAGKSTRAPSGKPWWDSEDQRDEKRPKLKTLKFRREPHEVLGLSRGANRAAIDEAYERLLAQNSPESVSSMSEEIQSLAQRKTEDIVEAYEALTSGST